MTTDVVTRSRASALLNKVPEVTAFFWLIKVLSTTIGETAADYLNETLGFGLHNTTYVMSAVFAVLLFVQFRTRAYSAPVYWATVVLISVVGTLVTDNLTDGFGVPLLLTTPIFAALLITVFGLWYRAEGTLSIHTINTRAREAWYWLAILVTFALGTGAGDLIAEQFGLGYRVSLGLFAGVIVAIVAAWRLFGLNTTLVFWACYVMTRPLGASLGDLMSASKPHGGLGIGTMYTSLIDLACITALVIYLAITRRDVQELWIEEHPERQVHPERHKLS